MVKVIFSKEEKEQLKNNDICPIKKRYSCEKDVLREMRLHILHVPVLEVEE